MILGLWENFTLELTLILPVGRAVLWVWIATEEVVLSKIEGLCALDSYSVERVHGM